MKRRVFLRYLNDNHCFLVREGGRHSVFKNSKNAKVSTIPRHNEINDFLVRKICHNLDIPFIKIDFFMPLRYNLATNEALAFFIK